MVRKTQTLELSTNPKPGVYVIPAASSIGNGFYVGESENTISRIGSHFMSRDKESRRGGSWQIVPDSRLLLIKLPVESSDKQTRLFMESAISKRIAKMFGVRHVFNASVSRLKYTKKHISQCYKYGGIVTANETQLIDCITMLMENIETIERFLLAEACKMTPPVQPLSYKVWRSYIGKYQAQIEASVQPRRGVANLKRKKPRTCIKRRWELRSVPFPK